MNYERLFNAVYILHDQWEAKFSCLEPNVEGSPCWQLQYLVWSKYHILELMV